ncbi:MAG TPA: 4-(cytidine 5'-diphospho)-2-C-methyl-D-erythritol kinase [Acidimicrobiales bacterium]|jgi:4-diphosphocytidyl-2-C-methyl-D-erythritol kinase
MTRLLAPAKLTLTLSVTGVRADGYHELRSEMVSLDLCDELMVEPGEGLIVAAEAGSRADDLGTGPGNLINRALALVGVRAAVTVRKRIPVGGGLGGGSTDAGAVLRWAGWADLEAAASLGADVPFCVLGGRALVEGIGERVTPLPFEARQFVLCVPPFEVDTARVYTAWDARPAHQGPNELTAAALVVEPRLAQWRDALGQLCGVEPVLAGSGSTWFAEGGPAEAGTAELAWVFSGSERARVLRVHTVPSGWDG